MSTPNKFQWPTVFSGLQGFAWADVPREISAGVTLAALIIPLNIGFTQVAGLPPVFGLYAGIIPLVIFALFTSSRHVVGSPDAPISAILGAMLIAFAPIGDPLRAQYALALSLMCGLLFFVFWFFRLAFLSNFLSRAVLAGFITGLGIEVLTNQVRRILGAAHGELSGSGGDRPPVQGVDGDVRRQHGIFRGVHRPVRVHTSCKCILRRGRAGRICHRAPDEKIRAQSAGCARSRWS